MTLIHQLVHGYRRGHELLAASTKLGLPDADLILRLSDLSGTLNNESEIRPYITSYPLPSGKFYALAKTWIDRDAPRAGCVLTHTFLIPIEPWTGMDVKHIASLLTLPSITNLDKFKNAVSLNGLQGEERTISFSRRDLVVGFVQKYFGEGLRPLVWLEESEPDLISFQIMNGLWPRLKAEFACCTFSLQPRSLDHKPFDLLFAPASAYSRFHKLSREHFLGGRGSVKNLSAIEPWCEELADFILYPKRHHSRADFQQLMGQLGEDPTSIRRLFLIKELRGRLHSSPTAAVGILDVVESIARDPNSALAFKQHAISEALVAADSVVDAQEALKCFMLIGERLTHPAFKSINTKLVGKISAAVSSLTLMNPEIALQFSQKLLVTRENIWDSTFVRGVSKGLRKLVISDWDKLTVLQHFPNLASLLIERDPRLALGYFRAIKTTGNTQANTHELIHWLESVQAPLQRTKIRNLLLPEMQSERDAPILTMLLEKLPESEIPNVLNTLYKSTRGYKSDLIRKVVEDKIAGVNAQSLRMWALTLNEWSEEIASLVAASYPASDDGLDVLLNSQFQKSRRAIVLTKFLKRIAIDGKYPAWFINEAKTRPRFLRVLVEADARDRTVVADQIFHILQQIRDIPISSTLVPADITLLADSPHGQLITDMSMRSVTKEFLDGSIDSRTLEEWYSFNWAGKWLVDKPTRELLALFGQSCRTTNSLVRAWNWVAIAPQQFFAREPALLPDLIDTFINVESREWVESVGTFWVKVLQRADKESPLHVRLKLCVQALQFAFSNPSLPVGPIVVETFHEVYSSVISGRSSTEDYGNLFSYFDWDRGKELRKRLVDSFFQSVWKPGDLALASRDPIMLRKIFKRLTQKPKGQKYAEAMYKDLESRTQKEAGKLKNELGALMKHPDYDEEWV